MRILTVCLIALLPTTIHAAPLESRHLPETTKWVAHIDMGSLRDSKIGEFIFDSIMMRAKERNENNLKELTEKTGIDLEKDLLGVTLFGSKFGNDRQAACGIIHMKKFNERKIVAAIQEASRNAERKVELEETTYGRRIIYTGESDQETMHFTMVDSNKIIGGNDLDDIKAALDTMDGKAKPIKETSDLFIGLKEESIVFFGAFEIDSRMVQGQAKFTALNAQISETEGQLEAEFEMVTDANQSATQMKQQIDGFMALMALQAAQIPELGRLLNGLKTQTEGPAFLLTLEVDSEDLIKAMTAVRNQRRNQRGPGAGPEPQRPGGDNRVPRQLD